MTGRIELRALSKTFHAGGRRIEAVRGLDVSIRRGETVALLGPNGAGKSTTIDMLLGLLPPDRGTVSVFGRPPRQAIAEGAVGAMLQTGGLIRDLTVRELVTMFASLFPQPLNVDEVLDLTGTQRLERQLTQKLSGGETQRVRFALALVANPEFARPRRADGRHGRRRAQGFLGDDAGAGGSRQDDLVRHPLPRGG
jgi:ABC-2 type transport system ATP-binding protein